MFVCDWLALDRSAHVIGSRSTIVRQVLQSLRCQQTDMFDQVGQIWWLICCRHLGVEARTAALLLELFGAEIVGIRR